MITVLFVACAAILVVSSLLVILHRNPVTSALFLVLAFCSLAGIYLLLGAEFIGMVQVIVYAGAIMVLFLFVIMLLNLGDRTPGDTGGWRPRKLVGGLVGLGLLAELFVLRRAVPPEAIRLPAGTSAEQVAAHGAVQSLAMPLFQAYLVPFEITSLLLLAAIVGAVVLAKRRL
jgi:NADH-quinone oxidoreductase subunit J